MTKLLFPLFALLAPHAHAGPWAVDLRPGLTPVKNQGERNTCSAFAATALAEFLLAGVGGRAPDLSESYTYWAGKVHGPGDTQDSDLMRKVYERIDGLAGFLAVQGLSKGVMRETDWPYEARNGVQRGDPGCSPDRDGEAPMECFTGRPPGRARPVEPALEPVFVPRDEIGRHLVSERTPVVLNIMLYPDRLDAKGNLRVPSAREQAACERTQVGCSGHVILLVGYDPDGRRFLFRNSWGPEWGQRGYGTIPEEYVLEHCELCYSYGVGELYEKGLLGVSARLRR